MDVLKILNHQEITTKAGKDNIPIVRTEFDQLYPAMRLIIDNEFITPNLDTDFTCNV